MRWVAVVACCYLAWLCCAKATADDPVFSGPQVGELLAPFKVIAVYDEAAGKEAEPVSLAAGKPTLLVFVHKLTRPGIALTRAVTSYADSQTENGAVSGIIWLQDDKAQAEEYLTRAQVFEFESARGSFCRWR